MKTLTLLFSACLFSMTTFAQDFQTKIRSAVENRDYATAIVELNSLKKSDKKLFQINNYDYLLARISEKKGDLATAMSNYNSVVKRKSVLSEYALWHLSQISRSSGNLMQERIYLRQLAVSAPTGLLKNAATSRTARSYFESNDFNSVISYPLPVISGRQSADKTKTENRENLLLLGQSYLQSGKSNEAREVFTKLITNLPNASQPDDFALAATKGLDELDGGKDLFGKKAPQITDTEHLRRATIYQFNRDFEFSRLHYQAIIERFPQSPSVAAAMFQIGRSYTIELRFNEAIQWFERVQSQFPEGEIAKDALSQTASAYARVNKPKEAISRYQKFIERFPDADNLERAYLNIVDIERDLGETSNALNWTQKTREAFKGELPEAVALFTQARIYIAENNWTKALADLDKLLTINDLGGTKVPGGTNKNEVTFLKAFVLEQLGRIEEAVDIYLSIPDGRGEYYGWRSTERLKLLSSEEKSKTLITNKLASLSTQTVDVETNRKNAQNIYRITNDLNILETIRKTYAISPVYQKIPTFKLQEFGRKTVLKDTPKNLAINHQTLADELLFLGLYDEATPELETALREKSAKNTNALSDFPPDTAFTLAVFYKRGDMANRAIAWLEPVWRQVPADYQIELMPREQAEILYPIPYADSLVKFGTEKNVDPRYLLSIMRQESRYRADIKSVAAARGLMQFISSTSNQIAGELGKTNFKQDELYNPPTAIQFGSQYMFNLFKMFPEQPQAVAASYNGGEVNMTRWLRRAKTDLPDKYVPEILFTQSKDYVYKVMANYRVYKFLYDEKLK
jgi:soluble lytic murein transglycosylase